MAQQICWADVLSQYNFLIMYRSGTTNRADALTRREQDLDNQTAAKISLQTQALLQPEHLDPQIQAELNTNTLDTEMCPVDSSELDFIDELLQVNCMAPSLQEYYEKIKNIASP